jgi:hypothetical protein
MTLDQKLEYGSGYAYRTKPDDIPPAKGERKIALNTGVGGAKMLVKEFRNRGVPDQLIEDWIQIFIQGQWVSLKHIIITKKSDMDNQQISPETQELLNAVDNFAEQMKQRLIEKGRGGYSGWKDHSPNEIVGFIEDRLPALISNPERGAEIGIANWCLIHHINKTKQNG